VARCKGVWLDAKERAMKRKAKMVSDGGDAAVNSKRIEVVRLIRAPLACSTRDVGTQTRLSLLTREWEN